MATAIWLSSAKKQRRPVQQGPGCEAPRGSHTVRLAADTEQALTRHQALA